MASIKFDITGDNSNILQSFQGVQQGVRQTQQVIESSGGSIESVFENIKNLASTAFLGFTAKEFVSSMAKTRGEFQQLEVAFETMLQSEEKATALMNQMVETAATTPFDLQSVAGGAKQLLAYGIAAEDVNETIRRLGDIASGLSISLDSLIRQYGRVQTAGQMTSIVFRSLRAMGVPVADELAQHFGVATSEVSKLITAGKVSADDFKDILWGMTDEGSRFGGLMEKQSHTIIGQLSNIGDAIDEMFNEMGKSSEGAINATLHTVKSLVENWETVGAAILAAAETIGIYKASMYAVNAMQRTSTALGYDAEIKSLEQIIPLKEAENATDIEEAVSSGRLSAAKAEHVAALRAEAAAYVQELEAKAAAATAAFNEASSTSAQIALDLEAAQVKVAACEQKYAAATMSGNATAIETAEMELNTAAAEANAIAKQLEVARTEAAAAATVMDTTAKEAQTASMNLNTAATVRDTTAKGLWAAVMSTATKVQAAFNASMFASPLFWIAATIAAVTYAIYKLVTAETAHEKAVRQTNEAWDEFNKKADERKTKIESLIRIVQDETSTALQQAEAYDELTKLFPALTDKYSQQELAVLDLDEAQKEYNRDLDTQKFEELQSKVDETTEKIESLKISLEQAAAQGESGWVMSYSKQLQEADEELSAWNAQLKRYLDLQSQSRMDSLSLEVKMSDARENEATRQSILDFYNDAMELALELQNANDEVNYDLLQSRLDDFIADAQKELDDLHQQMEDNPLDVHLQLEEQEKTKALNNLISMRNDWVNNGYTSIPLMFSIDYNSAQDALDAASGYIASLQGADSPTYRQDLDNAKIAWENARKRLEDIQANQDEYTTAEYNDAAKKLKEAKDAYAALGGDTSTRSSSTLSASQKKDRDAYNKLLVEQAKERERRQKDMLLSTQQSEIDIMEEGNEKTLRQIELDFEKEKEELEREYEDLKQTKIEEARKVWEANPDTNGKFDETTVDTSLSETEQANYDARFAEIEHNHDESLKNMALAEAQAMRDYLSEYGTYQQRKLAISEDYAEKIRKAQTEGERMTLEREQEAALQQVDIDALYQKIDWQGVLGGFTNVLGTELQETLKNLRQYVQTDEFRNMSMTDQQTVYDAIERLREVTPGGEGTLNFNKIRQQMDDLAVAIQKVQDTELALNEAMNATIDAQKAYELALESGDQDSIAASKANLEEAQKNQKEANEAYTLANSDMTRMSTDLTASQQDTIDGFDLVAEGLNNFSSGSLQSSFKGLQGVLDGLAKLDLGGAVGGAVGKLSEVLGSAGFVGQILSAILGLLDILSQGLGTIISSLIDSVFGAITGILDNILSGELFAQIGTSLWSGVSGVLNTLTFGLFAGHSTDKTLEDDMEKLAAVNEDLKNAINDLADEIKDASVADATGLYTQQLEYLQAEEANTANLMQRAGAARSVGFLGIGGHRSSNTKINNAMTADDWQRISDIVGKQVDSAADFFALSSKEMYDVYLNANDLYSKIKQYADDGYEDAAQYMDTYIEYWKEYEDIYNELMEKLTSTSFDDVRSSFKDLISDMENDTEDFCEAFESMMQEALIESLMTEKYDELLKNWYEEFAKAMEDAQLTTVEQENLRNQYYDLLNSAQQEVSALYDMMGWDNSAGTQEASTKGFQSMSQDTADELSGRFTALQISNENIYAQMILAVEALNMLVSFDTSANTAVVEIRNLMIISNSYLEDIVRYSRLTYNYLSTRLDQIKENTDRL